MSISNYIIPILLIVLFTASIVKRVPVYEKFTEGVKGSLAVVANIFPFLVAMFIAIELFNLSGATDFLVKIVSPVFNIIGIPKELTKLVLLKPFSASASLVALEEVFVNHGVDSYIGTAASIIMSSSDAVFYVVAVYFATTKIVSLRYAIPVALLVTLFSAQVSCLVAHLIT